MLNKIAWKEIDLSALSHNVSVIRKKIGNNVEIIPVVKADAYGHGAIAISKFLSKELRIKYLAVATVEEGIELRDNGLKGNVIVLSPQPLDSIPYFIEYNLTPVVSSLDFLKSLGEYITSKNISFSFHIGIDTGLGREGLLIKDIEEVLKIIEKFRGLKLVGLSSHLSSSEDKFDPYNERQYEIFERVYRDLKESGIEVFCHFANSGGIFNFPNFYYHGVRPGIALYGYGYPKLHLVMSVKARITLIKEVPENWGIGYGHTYITEAPTLIALVPLGYADGYRREFSNKAYVIIKGKKFPVIGRISMDQFAINITLDPSIKVGDEVVILGESENEKIDAVNLAQIANTIPYEILTDFGRSKRLGIFYKYEGKIINDF